MKTKSNIFNWVLYDFANSLVSVVFFLYFAQWIVIDKGVSDFYFNLSFTISAFILLLTVPITGTYLDKSWRRITGLRWTTILTALSYGVCALMAINNLRYPALIIYTFGFYFYLLSFTFYTPLINDIAKHSKRGFVSGLGIMSNYIGQILGLIIALPFATGKIAFFSASARAETLLPSVILFLLLSLPMLFFFKEPHKKKSKMSFRLALTKTFADTKFLILSSSAGFFLLSYFLYNDAIMTAINNFPIFLEQVWSVSDSIKTYLLLAILVTSAIGGILSGLVADRFGHKRTMVFILLVWAIIFPIIGLIKSWPLFIVICILMGLWYGASWAVSRSLMSHLTPKGKHNLTFGYFGLVERASALVGPLVWGAIATGLIEMGPIRYRIAMTSISIFVILGLLAMVKVRNERKKN